MQEIANLGHMETERKQSHHKRMLQTGTKGGKDSARLSGCGDLLGIVLGIKIWPYNQMICA